VTRLRTALAGSAIGFLLSVSPLSAASFFDEWRYPDESDVLYDWKDFRQEGREYYTLAEDFNGDGKLDEAWILIKKDASEWGLFVFLDAKSSDREIIELGRTKMTDFHPQRMGLALAMPGHHLSACEKGYGSGCEPGERRFVDLKNPAIDFFVFESANSYFFWNEAIDGFERIWISD
jgi:hypothetical protein